MLLFNKVSHSYREKTFHKKLHRWTLYAVVIKLMYVSSEHVISKCHALESAFSTAGNVL